MISKDQVIPLLIEACPSFSPSADDADLLYIMLGDFSRNLLQLQQENCTETFPAIVRVIERLIIEGEHYVQEAAVIGLLEGIQNVWSHSDVNSELFAQNLLPVSAKWWQSLNDFGAARASSLEKVCEAFFHKFYILLF